MSGRGGGGRSPGARGRGARGGRGGGAGRGRGRGRGRGQPDPELSPAGAQEAPVRQFGTIMAEDCLLKGEYVCVLKWEVVRDVFPAFPCCFRRRGRVLTLDGKGSRDL